MKPPRLIEFSDNCLTILQHSFLAVKPKEGCALLIGERLKSNSGQAKNIWRIHLTWPCCNAWDPGIMRFFRPSKKLEEEIKIESSSERRFFIDPREQLLAQKWARGKNWVVLGSAHSHPNGNNSPSPVDNAWNSSPGLMVIIDSCGSLRSWWMVNDQTPQPIEVKYFHQR